ncbi:ATP-binding protein [Micromonospora sp. DPT]|uniref:ATP-binding protein n=1 Tax=Micromonospora sp. DPT TaxID=3142975 RepID=UPI00320A24BA
MSTGGSSHGNGLPPASSDRNGPVVWWSQPFTAATVTAVRHAVAARVAAAGLTGDEADDFVLAVHELVINAVCHGDGSGRVELRRVDDSLVCDVVDHGTGSGGLPVHLSAPNVPGGRGLWLAQELTGALALTRRADGVTASVTVPLTAPDALAANQPDPAGAAADRRDASPAEGSTT